MALRWLAQHRVPAITAASAEHAAYMREDLAIFNWSLARHEMAQLDAATFANQSTVHSMCDGAA